MKFALRAIVLSVGWLGGMASAQAAGHAHVHGVARLDVAVDANTVLIHLDSPLDNILGFERAPRSDAERRQADSAIAQLRSGASIFRIDPAAQCRLKRVDLSSAALRLGVPSPEKNAEGHADIDGDFDFSCVDTTKARYIDVSLFEFARLHGLEIQVALPERAFMRDLQRPSSRISLLP